MPRNKKYKPQDVNSMNFVNLRRIFKAAPVKKQQNQIQWFAFNNSLFNYFQPARDANDSFNGQPLKETLQVYQAACKANFIPIGSITVIPLLLVINKRNHFNTFVMQREADNSYKLFRIEPHKTDKVGLISKYGFESFDEAVKSNFNDLKVATIYTGQQATVNDTQCGAHHINYVEAIAELSLKDRPFTGDAIKQALANKSLIARAQDQQLTHAINQLFKASSEATIVNKDQVSAIPNKILEKENIVQVDEFEEISNNDQKITYRQSIFDLSQNELNEFLSDTKLAINSAITILSEYNPNNQKSSQLGFFKKLVHSRQDTASWLINQLQSFSNQPNSTVEKTAMFLFGYYNVIQDPNSNLGKKLEEALVLLLGIEKTPEYKPVKRTEIFGFMQMPSVHDLIVDKLNERKVDMSELFKKNYKIYCALITYVEVQETSFLNKLKCVAHYKELNEVREWITKIFKGEQSFMNNLAAEINQYPKIAKAINLEKLLHASPQSNRPVMD